MALQANEAGGKRLHFDGVGFRFVDHRLRWIMIIEGLPTFVLGIATWWLLADSPETAYYLTPEERALMVVRKRREHGHTESADFLHKKDVYKGLLDWRIYMFCMGQFGADNMVSLH